MSRELVLEQQVHAEPAGVHAAWISAAALAQWWWPQIPDTTYEVDARVGGRYDIRSEAAGFGVCGEFLEIDPPRLIRMTWCWMNNGVNQVQEEVDVAFAPRDGGTLVTLTHHLDELAGDGEDLREGWRHVLGRLANHVRAG